MISSGYRAVLVPPELLFEATRSGRNEPPRREKQRYVFWNPATQWPITDIGNLWSKLRDEAGLPGVRIHDLRHSFARHAAAHSETLPMIGKLLGHTEVRTTTRIPVLTMGTSSRQRSASAT